MTDLLTYANSIKDTKEEIRTLLNNRGITVGETEKFSTYPAKINLLGRVPGTGTPTDESEILTVQNNSGITLNAGDKVFLYCTGNAQEETKKEVDSNQSNANYNNAIVSRDGSKVYLSGTNQLYDTVSDSIMAGGNCPYSNRIYRRIHYMSNNSIISSYYSDNSCYYLLFPNQSPIYISYVL